MSNKKSILVTGGAGFTLLELAGFNLNIEYESTRLGNIYESYAEISKAKKLLGYNPKVSLKNGLQSLLNAELGVS